MYIFFSVALRPKADNGHLIFEVSRSHKTTHQQSVGLLWASYRLFAETCTGKHTTITRDSINAPGGIRTYNPSIREATEIRLRPRDHWDQQGLSITVINSSILALEKVKLMSLRVVHGFKQRYNSCHISFGMFCN